MSDTPRTDAEWTIDYYCSGYVAEEFARQLERELAEAREELNDKRKFCYAVEQALDGLKGDYVEIIKELRKDAERYRYVRSIWGLPDEKFNAAIDAAMKEGGK
jgi:hypothetical protein